MKTLLLLIAIAFTFTGCTDAGRASMGSLGSKHTVILYSGGQEVNRWKSTGKVLSGEHGTRFAFVDAKTKKYVRVTGTVAVIQE